MANYLRVLDPRGTGDCELSAGTSGRGRFLAKVLNSRYFLHRGNESAGHNLLNPVQAVAKANIAQIRPPAVEVILVRFAAEKAVAARQS